ncbi:MULTISPECIES: TIGR04197 family type VII secretion effector [Listeria]|uniref:TIGR04197 family type VII secretion effector n=1 Tax=Listeria TaxID=1637 RepID=UPI0013565746|nr:MULTISPECIES: TIGR04197 family type VII secretion effector [Listeria]
MAVIQSNLSAATRVANQFGQAHDQMMLVNAQTIQRAERTVLNGNQEARKANQQVQQMVQVFNQCLMRDIGYIQQTAQEFERQDQSLQKLFE